MDEHAMKEMMDNFSKTSIFFFAVIIAPLLEELFFRTPITLFANKKRFRTTFYIIAILFGLIHLSNFNITTNTLLLAPILVAPQIILGGYLGYIRVRFGLIWSIFLHASYNAFFMLISFTSDLV